MTTYTPDMLPTAEVAAKLGCAPSTLRGYVARGQGPDPDVYVDGRPFWAPATVTAYLAERDKRAAKYAALLERLAVAYRRLLKEGRYSTAALADELGWSYQTTQRRTWAAAQRGLLPGEGQP